MTLSPSEVGSCRAWSNADWSDIFFAITVRENTSMLRGRGHEISFVDRVDFQVRLCASSGCGSLMIRTGCSSPLAEPIVKIACAKLLGQQ